MAVDKAIISHVWSTSILARFYISQLRKLLEVGECPLECTSWLDFLHFVTILLPASPLDAHLSLTCFLSCLFQHESIFVTISTLFSRCNNKAHSELQRRWHRWWEEKLAIQDKKKKKTTQKTQAVQFAVILLSKTARAGLQLQTQWVSLGLYAASLIYTSEVVWMQECKHIQVCCCCMMSRWA